MNYWLVKSEPDVFSWEQLVKDGRAMWDGVRNYQARNNLRAMKRGDAVLVYHSNIGKEIVGIARVEKTFYPDPTAKEGDWSVVDLVPVQGLKNPVTLETIKKTGSLKNMLLVRHSRLSVMPVQPAEYKILLSLSQQ